MPEHYIVCAAVKTTDWIVHTGKRHSNCFALTWALGWVKYHVGSIQWFVDNKWEFKTRSEAFKIAKKAGQLIDSEVSKRPWTWILYSEDIY